jgi:hypothetical protein
MLKDYATSLNSLRNIKWILQGKQELKAEKIIFSIY